VVGELGLKWFESVQTGLPMCIISSVFGPIRLSHADKEILRKHYIPWALAEGIRARPLITVQFEKEFGTNIDDLRHKLNMKAAPMV
jgi:ubiquinone biosynthesis protein COQ4